MKQLLFVASAIMICSLFSCSNKESGGMSEKAKKNLDASHIISDGFMSGDTSKIDDAVASDYVEHSDRGKMNRDSLKSLITTMKKLMPDMKMKLIKEVADDDYVFSAMEFTGTSNGQMGMPAGPYDFHAIQMEKFKDGKAVEHWEYTLTTEMMKMMQSSMGSKMDSTMSKMDKKK